MISITINENDLVLVNCLRGLFSRELPTKGKKKTHS